MRMPLLYYVESTVTVNVWVTVAVCFANKTILKIFVAKNNTVQNGMNPFCTVLEKNHCAKRL